MGRRLNDVHVIWLVLILVPYSLTVPAPVKREVFPPAKAKTIIHVLRVSASVRIRGQGESIS